MSCSVALVMAGGKGSRLGYVAKPFLELCGKPMVSHVVEKVSKLCRETIIALSRATISGASSVCRLALVDCIETSGADYVKDLSFALNMVRRPALVLPSDTPFVSRESLELLLHVASECAEKVVTLCIECSEPVGISLFKDGYEGWCNLCVPKSTEFLNVNTPSDLELARSICLEGARGSS